MSQIGVIVSSSETPPSVSNTNNTANAFMVGFADWGPTGITGVTTPVSSLAAAVTQIGQPNGGLVQTARTATNATLYDSADAFFREGGANLYISRVVGPTPTFGGLAVPAAAGTACTLTAAYVGPGSAAINVVVNNTGAAYTITLQDGSGNVLATSPSLSNTTPKTDLIAWAATTGIVTATDGNSSLPKTAVATPLSAGVDDHANATITNWTNALNLGFGQGLGPGQVMAPNQSNTNLAGIWSALALHAQSNNRIALLDGKDGNTATQAIAEVTTAALSSAVLSYCGIWAGNLLIPGITSGTTRAISPSPVVAALCARADVRGNPNIAAAGSGFPLAYVSGLNTTYTNPLTGDIALLNGSGINVFAVQFGTLQNFGFVSAVAVPTTDAIYWQLSHGRLRMAIINNATVVSQPFVFSQIDGQGQTISAFGGALGGMLLNFLKAGALYGVSANDAFSVDVGSTTNTPASLSAGLLQANLAVRMSPFAQLVKIVINAVPITQSLP